MFFSWNSYYGVVIGYMLPLKNIQPKIKQLKPISNLKDFAIFCIIRGFDNNCLYQKLVFISFIGIIVERLQYYWITNL